MGLEVTMRDRILRCSLLDKQLWVTLTRAIRVQLKKRILINQKSNWSPHMNSKYTGDALPGTDGPRPWEILFCSRYWTCCPIDEEGDGRSTLGRNSSDTLLEDGSASKLIRKSLTTCASRESLNSMILQAQFLYFANEERGTSLNPNKRKWEEV